MPEFTVSSYREPEKSSVGEERVYRMSSRRSREKCRRDAQEMESAERPVESRNVAEQVGEMRNARYISLL